MLTMASSHLDDAPFLEAFERCELPLAGFRHGDHLRMAWLYVHESPAKAEELVRAGIQRFAAHHGVAQIYHETMTTAWVRLITTHGEASFAEFVERNEARLNTALLHRFWTPEVLASEAARVRWVKPDRAPLPRQDGDRQPTPCTGACG